MKSVWYLLDFIVNRVTFIDTMNLLFKSLLIGAFICLAPGIALSLDSDGDGISDEIEASSGKDPTSRHAVATATFFDCAVDDTRGRCWGALPTATGDLPSGGSAVSGVAALLGKPETRTLLQECEAAYVSGSESLVHFGSPFMAATHLSDYDQAFVWLDRSIENRDMDLAAILFHEKQLEMIRRDARFGRALKKFESILAEGSPTESVAWQRE